MFSACSSDVCIAFVWMCCSQVCLCVQSVHNTVAKILLVMYEPYAERCRFITAQSETQWTSAQRGDLHNQKIADTIIGDCIAARQYFCHQPITREENGIVYLGYRKK